MSINTEYAPSSSYNIMSLITDTLEIRTHREFLKWAQGALQEYLPHDLMIAAWGDFSLGIIYYDVISPIPGARSDIMHEKEMVAFLKRLYSYWISKDRSPFQLSSERGVIRCRDIQDAKLKASMKNMKTALLHAIKDVRGGSDSFYVLLSASPDTVSDRNKTFHYLLPFIDATLRQIEHMPDSAPDEEMNETVKIESALNLESVLKLSDRESEIMGWVCSGKTNIEIGQILDISSFTVKNHLQRIFKKLDVVSRSQAVAKIRGQVLSS